MLEELVEKARRGNKKAFELLAEKVRDQLFKTALLQLRNEDDALDAVQEALTKAYINIGTLRQSKYFKTWIVRILLNECHNIRNYNNKVVTMENEYTSSEDMNESDVHLNCILDGLDEKIRVVVDLRYNHRFKLYEIGEILDIPEGTVKSRLNRAYSLLRKEYGEKEAL